MKINIHLPMPVHLRKYLELKFGPEYHATQADWFGLLILNILSKKSHYDAYERKATADGASYTVTIKLDRANRVGFLLTSQKASQLVKAIEKQFRQEMYTLALLNERMANIDYKVTMLNFMESCAIGEDELPYETVRRDFNRVRAEMISRMQEMNRY